MINSLQRLSVCLENRVRRRKKTLITSAKLDKMKEVDMVYEIPEHTGIITGCSRNLKIIVQNLTCLLECIFKINEHFGRKYIFGKINSGKFCPEIWWNPIFGSGSAGTRTIIEIPVSE